MKTSIFPVLSIMTLFLLPIQGKVPSALISFQGKCLVANGLDAYASDPFAHGDDSGDDPYGHADTAKECVDNCILGMTKRFTKLNRQVVDTIRHRKDVRSSWEQKLLRAIKIQTTSAGSSSSFKLISRCVCFVIEHVNLLQKIWR